MEFEIFYSSSELELESSEESSPALSVEAGGSGGAKVLFNAGTGREVGNIDLRSRSDLTSLEYLG